MTRIVRKRKRQFEIPPPGAVKATLKEFKDLDPYDFGKGPVERIALVWKTAALDNDGFPIEVWQRCTNVLAPKSTLSKTIRQITGEDPSEEFDIDTLLGIAATLIIEHREGNDGIVWPNVVAVTCPQTAAEIASQQRVQKVIDAASAPKPSVNLDAEDPDNSRPDKRIPF